jgi:hypothetical protein
MAEPLRHRQTKEADNRYVRPTATAPHLDSTLVVSKRLAQYVIFRDCTEMADLPDLVAFSN